MIALFAEVPALPLHAAGKYVAGAYIAFLLIILVYVAIMARRLVHNQRDLVELRRMVAEREALDAQASDLAAASAVAASAKANPASGASREPRGPRQPVASGEDVADRA